MGDEEVSFLNTEFILLELSFGNCKLLVLKNIIMSGFNSSAQQKSYLSEGHFHLGIPIEVELSNSISIFQYLQW